MTQGLPHEVLSAQPYGAPPVYGLIALLVVFLLLCIGYLIYLIVVRSKTRRADLSKASIYIHCRLAARERMNLLKGELGEGSSREIQFGNSLSLRRLLGSHFGIPLEAATHGEALEYLRTNKKTRKSKYAKKWEDFLSRANEACYGNRLTSLDQLKHDCQDLMVWVSSLEKKSLEVDLLQNPSAKKNGGSSPTSESRPKVGPL